MRAVLCVIALAGCGARSRHPAGGPDAGLDAGLDAGRDAGVRDASGGGDASTCPDGDGDGHAAIGCGGDDCDDADAAVFPGAHVWDHSRIEEGDHPAIAIDDRGRVDVAFSGGNFDPWDWLVVASDFGGWIVTGIETEVAPRPTIDVDGGLWRIAYYAAVPRDLRFVHLERVDGGSDWTIETIEAGVDLQPEIDAEWTSGARIAVVYSTAVGGEPGELRVATGGWGTWTRETVDLGPASAGAIAEDAAGRTLVSYRAQQEVLIAVRDERTGAWAVETLDELNVGASATDLALGPDGRVRVVYEHPHSGVPGGVLQVSVGEPGAWELEAIPTSAWSFDPSIAIGPDGVAHVAFEAEPVEGEDGLYYASDAAGEWRLEEILAGARDPAIAVGSDGVPQIAYVLPGDVPAQGVWHARRRDACAK